MIWSKAFVQERERFDGADVLHLLREAGPRHRLGRGCSPASATTGRCSSATSFTFHFAYPDRRDRIPPDSSTIWQRASSRQPNEPGNRVCYGTLLSREQYLPDVEQLGYEDARLEPRGNMSREELRLWSEAIGR